MKNFNLKLTQITPQIKNKKKIFYLGAWCLADMEGNNYKDYVIHKYHWNDRSKLNKDYAGLNNYISNNFEIFTKYMGDITDNQKNFRYWKINLGTWLGYLIQILFDRWENVRTMPEFNYNLQELSHEIVSLRSNTVRDFFVDLFTDHWNEEVYRLILKAQKKKINYENLSTINTQSSNLNENKKSLKRNLSSLKLLFSELITRFAHKIKEPKYFIINSYLSRFDELKLKLYLREIPINYERLIFDPKINYKKMKIENSSVNKIKINFKINENNDWENQNKDFLYWFSNIVPKFIPYNYSLNFNSFVKNMKSLPFPQNPKIVFTSVLHVQHDYFNLYTSEKVFSGSKYFIGQHGGTFRSSKLNYVDHIQKELPDCYLTWGKDNHNEEHFPAKITPVGNLKISSKNFIKRKIKKKRILLLTAENSRHSYMISSVVISSQWLDYFQDIKNFVKTFQEFNISDTLILRNKLRKNGWNFDKKLKNQIPDIIFDDIKDYYKSLKSSSLVISTYNGATYLETMSLNMPTVFFWNPSFWELRDNSIKDYEKLLEVGIFHTDAISAAKFVNKIYNDIDGWWFSESVQTVRKKFCEKYSKKNKNLSKEIMKVFIDK